MATTSELSARTIGRSLYNPFSASDAASYEQATQAEQKELPEQAEEKQGAEKALILMMRPHIWALAIVFVSATFICVILAGDTFFGLLTGGVVESLRLGTAVPMSRHMIGGSLMWGLGAFQFLGKGFRRGYLAWLHRLSGRVFLFLWCVVVGPTAAYLSTLTGVGPANAQIHGAIFCMVSLETTIMAYYFFLRAFLIARRRERGEASLVLHGQAMTLGILLTMTILAQRPIQFVLIGLRMLLLLIGSALPNSWSSMKSITEGVAIHILDHHRCLSQTTWLGGMGVLFFDGPRAKVVRLVWPLDASSARDLFGSEKACMAELLFWRLRWPVYFLLRAYVTNGFSEDPNPIP